MPVTHHLDRGPNGAPLVVVKVGRSGHDADRLRREAKVLLAARHVGVVELLEAADTGDGESTLTMRYAGGAAAGAALDLEQVLTLVGSLAATLADLHDRGVVHGRIDGDHVLVHAEGGAVLCGLAEARLPAEPGPGPTRGDDVAAVGRLLDRLVAGTSGPATEALRAVAQRAAAEEPNRPTARGLAAMLDAVSLAHGARPGRQRPVPPPRALTARRDRAPRRSSALRRSTLLGGGLAAAMVIAVVMLVLAYQGGAEQGAGSAPEAVPSSTTVAPATSRSACPAVAAGPSADIDGDGCEEALAIAAGVVEMAGTRWHVGEAADLTVVADWDCDGAATPAVIRPATGEVWVFGSWAVAGEAVVSRPAGRAVGPVAASAVDADGDGCPELAVVDVNGVEQVLRLYPPD